MAVIGFSAHFYVGSDLEGVEFPALHSFQCLMQILAGNGLYLRIFSMCGFSVDLVAVGSVGLRPFQVDGLVLWLCQLDLYGSQRVCCRYG